MAPPPSAPCQPPIENHAFLSDCHSAALVDRHGSIDWWCVPRFDSPSVFGRLLDPDAGHWTLAPVGVFEVERSYVGDSLVLRSVFRTATGEVSVVDAAAVDPGARGHDLGLVSPHTLIRRVEGVQGSVLMEIEFRPRMEYGRTEPHLRPTPGGIVARGGPAQLTLTTSVELACTNGSANALFEVASGEIAEFRAVYEPTFGSRLPLATPRSRHSRTRSLRGTRGRTSTTATPASTRARSVAVHSSFRASRTGPPVRSSRRRQRRCPSGWAAT
jgi:hypothetical protein